MRSSSDYHSSVQHTVAENMLKAIVARHLMDVAEDTDSFSEAKEGNRGH